MVYSRHRGLRSRLGGVGGWRGWLAAVTALPLLSLAVSLQQPGEAAAAVQTSLQRLGAAQSPFVVLMSHVPSSYFGCTAEPQLDLGGAGVAFGYKATAEVDCEVEGVIGVSLAIYMLYPSKSAMNAAFQHVWVSGVAKPKASAGCASTTFVTRACNYWTGSNKTSAGEFIRFNYTQFGTPGSVPAIAWTTNRFDITTYLAGAESNDRAEVLKYWESGAPNPVQGAASASGGSSGGSGQTAAGVANAQLTGLFSVTLNVTSPAQYAGQKYSVSWSFTPSCGSGACSVQVSTSANACPSGQCAQPPSAFQFADETLAYSAGHYKGSFVVTTSCNSSTGYWPYAYSQRTTLDLAPTAAAKVGTVGSQPLTQVSEISGTLTITGTPNSTGEYQGCAPYADTLSVRGTSQSQ